MCGVRKMRLWSLSSESFTCGDADCAQSSFLSGKRYSCFVCDFDMCEECVERRLAEAGQGVSDENQEGLPDEAPPPSYRECVLNNVV